MRTPELEGWRRYVVVTAGVLASGAVCVQAVPFLISPRGTIGPTMLQAQSAAAAIIATVICFGLATGIAALVGRLVNAAVGMFVLGAGLWALRLRSGTIEDLAFAGGSLPLAAVETVLWAVLIAGATAAVFRVAGPLTDMEGAGNDEPAWKRLPVTGPAAGVLVVPAVWILARSDLKGQTLAGVILGGLVVGLVGRLLSPGVQPRLLFAAPCLFGALGQVIGMLMLHEPLAEAFVAGNVPALCRPMPIDYAAGSLAGVAMGLGWAKSFLQQEQPRAAPQADRTAP